MIQNKMWHQGDIKEITFFIDALFSIQGSETTTDRYNLQSTNEDYEFFSTVFRLVIIRLRSAIRGLKP